MRRQDVPSSSAPAQPFLRWFGNRGFFFDTRNYPRLYVLKWTVSGRWPVKKSIWKEEIDAVHFQTESACQNGGMEPDDQKKEPFSELNGFTVLDYIFNQMDFKNTWSKTLADILLSDEFCLLGYKPCSPLKVSRRFGGTCYLHLQNRRISQARNQREVGCKIVALYCRRQNSW
jgi:hypothetical protein